MKLINLINQMRRDGFKINYRIRTDGGVIITSINGVKFSGAKGNTALRDYAGVKLSTKQEAQRQYNVKKFIKLNTEYNTQRKKVKTLDDDIKKVLRKVQRLWRKSDNIQTGNVTARKVKYRLKHFGREEALNYLSRMELRARGIAYPENVEYLATEISKKGKSAYALEYSDDFDQLANDVLAKKSTFMDAWIYPSYDALYNCKTTIQCKKCIDDIRSICKL